MSKNFTGISSVRKFVDFSQGNDFKSEIFQDVDFKNSGNHHCIKKMKQLDLIYFYLWVLY